MQDTKKGPEEPDLDAKCTVCGKSRRACRKSLRITLPARRSW